MMVIPYRVGKDPECHAPSTETIVEKTSVTPRVAESLPAKVCCDGWQFYVLNLTVASFSNDWDQAL